MICIALVFALVAILVFLFETDAGQSILGAIILYAFGFILFGAMTLVTFNMWVWEYISIPLLGGFIGGGLAMTIMDLEVDGWEA